MKGIRIESYTNEILKIKEILEEYEDLIQVGILHELIDDTPYKTENYLKYNQDNYNVVHNKKNLLIIVLSIMN